MVIDYKWVRLPNKNRFLQRLLKTILVPCMFISINVSAALSATTLKTIVGHGPQYIGSNNRLSFNVNGTKYSETDANISSNTAKGFDAQLTFKDFVVNSTLSFTESTDYKDTDGDSADLTTPIIYDTITYSWVDAAGTTIAPSNYSSAIGCDSSYTFPLTLQIQAANIKTFSQYGDPRESESVTLTKAYKILPTGICYVKPYAVEKVPTIQWYSFDSSGAYKGVNLTDYTTPHAAVGGGYTSDYIPNKGFKAKPTVSSNNFPTTGFPGAKFQLVMAGSQDDYTFSVHSGTGVTTSDGTGYVRFISKPSGSVTIRATLNSETSTYYDYTFNPTGNWVVPQSKTVTAATYANASKICTNMGTSFPTRENFTNSPQISVTSMTVYVTNSWIRAIGGGLSGEWGPLNTTGYPDSNWPSTTSYVYYWTSEAASSVAQFVVSNTWGDVNYSGLSGTANYRYVACKG